MPTQSPTARPRVYRRIARMRVAGCHPYLHGFLQTRPDPLPLFLEVVPRRILLAVERDEVPYDFLLLFQGHVRLVQGAEELTTNVEHEPPDLEENALGDAEGSGGRGGRRG